MKQDARRFGVPFLNPCVNRSLERCRPEVGSVRVGLEFIKDVGLKGAQLIVAERERGGLYKDPSDLVRRTGMKTEAIQSLALAGAFDGLVSNRRQALWNAGLGVLPGRKSQPALPLTISGQAAQLPDFSDFERMAGEYRVLGIYPDGHLMQFVRPGLDRRVLPTTAIEHQEEGTEVWVAGWPVARQHPRGQHSTVFVTIEDEEGDTQLIVWPPVFERCKQQLRSQVILARGHVSHRRQRRHRHRLPSAGHRPAGSYARRP